MRKTFKAALAAAALLVAIGAGCSSQQSGTLDGGGVNAGANVNVSGGSNAQY